MSNIDYSFMQTGFQNLQGIEQLSHTEKATLLSTIVVYFEEAIKIAEGIVVYENRIEITAKDIVLALKVQALDHTDIWETEDTKNRVREGYQEIYQDLTTPGTLTESEEDEEDDNNEVEIEEIKHKLDDTTYQLIKSAPERWNQWEPTDQINIVLKSAIDNTEKKINENDILVD